MRHLLCQVDDWLFEREGVSLPLAWGSSSDIHLDALGMRVAIGPHLAVEYDGNYYHRSSRRTNDIMKSEALINAGILVARIREQVGGFELAPFLEDDPHILMVDVGAKTWRRDLPRAIRTIIRWADSFAG